MKAYYRIGAAAVVFIIVLAGALHYRSNRLQEDLSEQILRFHVIANSDTEEDQELKLKVRDKIGAYLGKELGQVTNLEECEKTVQKHLPDIERCAKTILEEEGYAYSVKAKISDTKFPKKTYGNYTFPKGEYRALTVVIGSGSGKNWWCVMYPNLCFSGSMYEVIDENSKEELRAVLSEEDYAEIMAEGELRVRFKYLDGLLSLFGVEEK